MSRWIVMVNVPEGFVLYIYFYACVNAVPIARPIFMEPLRVKPIKMEKLRSRFAFARYARLEAAIVNGQTGRFPFCGREASSSGSMRDETVSYDDQPSSSDFPDDGTWVPIFSLTRYGGRLSSSAVAVADIMDRCVFFWFHIFDMEEGWRVKMTLRDKRV